MKAQEAIKRMNRRLHYLVECKNNIESNNLSGTKLYDDTVIELEALEIVLESARLLHLLIIDAHEENILDTSDYRLNVGNSILVTKEMLESIGIEVEK